MALFTTDEARAFKVKGQTPLSSVAAAEITEAQARIKESFEDICGVAFEPTARTVTLNGTGTRYLLLPNTRVTAISSAEIDDDALTVSDVDVFDIGQLYYASGWTSGLNNITITYTHGHATVPRDIKRAALIVAVDELVNADVLSRATSQTDQLGTFRLSIPDPDKARWYGIPSVDSVLQRHRENVTAIG